MRYLSGDIKNLWDKDKMDEHCMPTEKRIDSDVTELRPETEHPSNVAWKLTNNEYETGAHRTMHFVNKYI